MRDDYTTLPDRRDRPLYVGLDVAWRYADPADALGADPARYVAGRAGARPGLRRLRPSSCRSRSSTSCTRWAPACSSASPSLAEVSFEGRNLTRDPVVEGVYTDPFPAHGTITLTMRR